MKVGKNMDSVFADCTDDELDFELLFGDSEDCLVDLVAGVNEAGEWLTEDFEGMSEAQLLELEGVDVDDDSICEVCGKNPCECSVKKEEAELDGAAEDTEGAATDSEGTGEDKCGVGCADNQGVAPGLAGVACGNDTSDDPITDEAQKEAADASAATDVKVDEPAQNTQVADESVDTLLAALDEAEESIADPDDEKARDGKVERDTDNVEGVSTEVPSQAMDKASTEKDPIEDCDDACQRDGKCADESDKEGVDQPVVGAAADTNANGDVEDAAVKEALDDLLAALDEEDDMLTDKDDAQQREDKVATTKEVEGTEDKKLEIGGEVGDGKEVSGKEDSAEKAAYDDKKEIDDAIGLNDKQQVKLEDAAEGPLEDDDPAEREGKVSPEANEDPAQADDAYSENVDALLATLDEEDDILTDEDDAKERDGAVKHDTSDVEGVKQDVVGTAIDGGNKVDVSVDLDDAEQRDGKTAPKSGEEAVDQTAVGAALEDADFVDDLLAALDADEEIKNVELVVPDDVKTNGTSSVEEAVDAEELAEDLDDEDIEAIDSESEDTDNKDYSYDSSDDDDELIDAVINGIDLD